MGIVTTWCITVIEAIIASRLIYPMPGKTIAKQHETFCGRTLLGRARSKEYLRKREEEGTKILSRREREEDRIGEDELCRRRCARKAGSLEPREMNEVYKKEARGKRS